MKITVTLKTGPSELSCGGRNLRSGVPVEVEVDESTALGREQLGSFESEPCVEVRRHDDRPKHQQSEQPQGQPHAFGKQSKKERKRAQLEESKGFAKPRE